MPVTGPVSNGRRTERSRSASFRELDTWKLSDVEGTLARTNASEAGEADSIGQIDGIIGNFGKFQLLVFLFKILIGMVSAFNNLGVTFLAPSDFVGFWCADNLSEANGTLTMARANVSLAPSSGLILDFLQGTERHSRHQSHFKLDKPRNLRRECQFYSINEQRNMSCSSYNYDTTIWISTMVDEWDLVCDRSWLVSLTQSLYMSGFIISFLSFGYLSDHFGRWRSLLLGALIEICSGFACALAPSITWFLVFRFLLGLGNAGRSSSSYLIMIEWSGPRWRMHVSTLGAIGWIIGYSLMPWIQLYYLHFRHFQLFVCLYESIFLIWLLRLPESPRWLLIQRRFDEAHQVLLDAARFNGLIRDQRSLPGGGPEIIKRWDASQPELDQTNHHGGSPPLGSLKTPLLCDVAPHTMDQFNAKFRRLVKTIEAKEFTAKENKLNMFDLFRWTNIRRYSLILFFIWACNSFIYYGIALGVADFSSTNLFVSFTIAGLIEIPSLFFTIICMQYLNRRTTNVFLFITIGFLCAFQLPLKIMPKSNDYQWLQQSTMMLAKLVNTCSFTCILYQTMELFPTSIRQTAYSSCALAGRIGSILAPFIKQLSSSTNAYVPVLIYTTLSLLEALFARSLPETKGCDLPDTMLEAEKVSQSPACSPRQLQSIVSDFDNDGNGTTNRRKSFAQ